MCKILIAACVICCSLNTGWVSAQDGSADSDDPKLTQAIADLSSDQYQVRKAAIRSLNQSGAQAIGPIARAILNGDPETKSACLKILGRVGVSGDEATMLRVGLVMDRLSRSGYTQLDSQVHALGQQWRIARLEENIEKLEQAGASVQTYRTASEIGAFASPVLLGGSGFTAGGSHEPQHTEETKVTKPRIAASQAESDIESYLEMDESQLAEAFRDEIGIANNGAQVTSATQTATFTIHEGAMPAREIEIAIALPAGDSTLSPVNGMDLRISTITIDQNWTMGSDFELLGTMPHIPSLILNELEVTEEMLTSLAKINGLTYLSLTNCTFDRETVNRISENQTRFQVTASGQAFMGVTGTTVSDELTGCQIDSIVEETAAEAADLQVNDIVTAVNGSDIVSFDDLVLEIASRKPEEEIELDIHRDGESIKVKVVLGIRQ